MALEMSYPVISDDVQTAADKIRTDAEAAYARTRGDGRLNTATIAAEIAKAFYAAQQRMKELERTATDKAGEVETQRIAAAWGIDDIAGSNAVDRAAAAMAYRDAIDRAEQLTSEQAAQRLLSQATDTGDELLARAVGRWAYTNGWSSTVDAYIADRPKAAVAVGALGDSWSLKPNLKNLWAFVVPKPAELANVSDYQVFSLATAGS